MTQEKCYKVGMGGVSLKVKARPGARKDALAGIRGSELVVEVRARAEKGLANEAVRQVLADALGVPRAGVSLKIGAGSTHKVFLVPGEALAALARLYVSEKE